MDEGTSKHVFFFKVFIEFCCNTTSALRFGFLAPKHMGSNYLLVFDGIAKKSLNFFLVG